MSMDEQDKRTIVLTVRISPAVDQRIRESGQTGSGWVWDAILMRLAAEGGYEDGARRPARRRRNYAQRGGTDRQQAGG